MGQTLFERAKQISTKIDDARELVKEINKLLFGEEYDNPVGENPASYRILLANQIVAAEDLYSLVKDLANYVWNGTNEHIAEDVDGERLSLGEMKDETDKLEAILYKVKDLLKSTKDELFASPDETSDTSTPDPNIAYCTYDYELGRLSTILAGVYIEANEILTFIRPEPEIPSPAQANE